MNSIDRLIKIHCSLYGERADQSGENELAHLQALSVIMVSPLGVTLKE